MPTKVELPENFYVTEIVPGIYFRSDDPERKRMLNTQVGMEFFSEPSIGPVPYDGWCVIPIKGHEPDTYRVGLLGVWAIGTLDRNVAGQIKGSQWHMDWSYDESLEIFSRDIYAVRDEDLPITNGHESPDDTSAFLVPLETEDVRMLSQEIREIQDQSDSTQNNRLMRELGLVYAGIIPQSHINYAVRTTGGWEFKPTEPSYLPKE